MRSLCRYAALVCFLQETHADAIDHLVDLHAKMVTQAYRRAQRRHDEELKAHRRSLMGKLSSFRTIGGLVLDESVTDAELRKIILEQVPMEKLREQVDETEEWLSGAKSDVFSHIKSRFSYFRQFSPSLFEHLSLETGSASASDQVQGLVESVDILRRMNKDSKRIADWHLHEDLLRAALADIVNAISRLDTARVWGEAKTSSSDGQRFLFPRKTLQRTYSHRMGDYALEFYSFVADNYAPFYSTPIESTERDAAYVLDGLLYHEADLEIDEHYTDTHGYTEANFAAFALLGKRFCPRIRGLSKQRIYRIDKTRDYGPLQSMLSRRDRQIHLDWIEEEWDRIGQFFSSMATGHTTASVAMKRLVAFGSGNHFYRAVRDLGRVFKTEFVLDYLTRPALRRRVRQGLLKSEELHALARLSKTDVDGELPAAYLGRDCLLADQGSGAGLGR